MAAGGQGESADAGMRVVYCIVPADLARDLHEPLLRHFRDDPEVEVVVEYRTRLRRTREDRRADGLAGAGGAGGERRRIRAALGRRAGERRAPQVPTDKLPLPRKARKYSDRIVFAERCEPTSQRSEDIATARIVTRIQAGEDDAFGELYMRYFDRVFAYMRVVCRNPHVAEDLTQQVFLKALEAMPRYERRDQPFRAWLFTIVRNTAVHAMQRESRIKLVDPHSIDTRRDRPVDPDPIALSWISDRDLLLFIERLPLAQRQVLVLRYLMDLPTARIAEILGRTPSDVRTLQSRALHFLHERLDALGREPSHRGLIRMRRWGKPASVLRSRRFALLGN